MRVCVHAWNQPIMNMIYSNLLASVCLSRYDLLYHFDFNLPLQKYNFLYPR